MMLRYFLLFASMLHFGPMLAQAGFSWGVSLFPNYSDRRLIAFEYITQEDIFKLDSIESGKFSYAGGVFAHWRSEKVGFQAGVNLMNTGYRTIRGLILPDDPDQSLGNERRFVYRNLNIEVPLELHFFQEVSPGNEFIFILGTAVSYNLANDTYKLIYADGAPKRSNVTDEEAAFRATNIAFVTAIGWEHSLSDRLSLVIQPTFEFWMRGILYDVDLNRNLYNIGVKVNLKFKRQYE